MKKGTLYLIPAPLAEDSGLENLGPHGKRQLACISHFIVENPKRARQFLKLFGLPLQRMRMEVLDRQAGPDHLARLLAPLLAGSDVGVLSDAGCPAVADPGADIVRLAHAQGIRVAPLAGASSIVLALMASGLNGQRFAFHGYLPADRARREQRLRQLERESRSRDETEIFIETPHRNRQMLESALGALSPETEFCIATDLTGGKEAILTMTIADWKGRAPDFERRPSVFLLYAGADRRKPRQT